MTKPVDFPTHEGQTNYPTWATMLVVDNDQEACIHYRKIAKLSGQEAVKDSIIKGVKGRHRGHLQEIHEQITESWLNYSVRKIDWHVVHELLAGREAQREPDVLTELAIHAMKDTDWQDVVKGFEYKFEADSALQEWLQTRADLWKKFRVEGKGSQLAHFCTSACEICLAVVDWKSVYQDFLEE